MQRVVERVLRYCQRQGETIDFTFITLARHLNLSQSELLFIEEVIEGCCKILKRIITREHNLCYWPMRIFSRMMSSSIFLLKALALGTRHDKLQESLSILDNAVAALRNIKLDDTHLATQYGELLEIQVSRLRRSLQRTSPLNLDRAPDESGTQPSVTDVREELGPSWGDDQNMADFDLGLPPDFDDTDWLALSFEPSMAPFENWNEQLGGSLEAVDSSLDFIWNLPP